MSMEFSSNRQFPLTFESADTTCPLIFTDTLGQYFNQFVQEEMLSPDLVAV